MWQLTLCRCPAAGPAENPALPASAPLLQTWTSLGPPSRFAAWARWPASSMSRVRLEAVCGAGCGSGHCRMRMPSDPQHWPLSPAGNIPNSNVAFIADACASMMAGLLGSSGQAPANARRRLRLRRLLRRRRRRRSPPSPFVSLFPCLQPSCATWSRRRPCARAGALALRPWCAPCGCS